MKFAFSGFLALAFIALAAPPPALATANAELSDVWNAPAVAWRDSAAGLAEAGKTGKPVVMVFHAQWCPNCRQYREVFRDPAVIGASKGFVMILVDIDRHPEINAAYAPDGPLCPAHDFPRSGGKARAAPWPQRREVPPLPRLPRPGRSAGPDVSGQGARPPARAAIFDNGRPMTVRNPTGRVWR